MQFDFTKLTSPYLSGKKTQILEVMSLRKARLGNMGCCKLAKKSACSQIWRVCVMYVSLVCVFGGISGCASTGKSSAAKHDQIWVPPAVQRRAKMPFIAPDLTSLDADVKLDLPMLLDMAFANNPNTKKSWYAARIALARKGQANSVLFPHVTISGMASRAESTVPDVKNKRVSESLFTSYYPAIEMQYSIFQFGGHLKSAEAAKELLYAANYSHNRTLQTLAHDVQKAYFKLDTAEAGVEAAEKSLRDAEMTYDAAFVKHQNGLTNVQDFLRAKASKTKAEFDLQSAKSFVESARANLAVTVGVAVSSRLEIARTVDETVGDDFQADVQELINDSVQIREDVWAAQATLAAQKSSVYAVTTKLLPELVIGGSGSKQSYRHISGMHDNFKMYAGLQWTLFDGFKNIYDVLEAKAKVKQAELDLQQKQLTVAAEVWANYHAFKSAWQQLLAAKNFEHASQESFDAISVSYKNGLSSLNDLLAAQAQLAMARQERVASKNNLSIAIVDLAYATGIMNFEQKGHK